MTDSVAGVLRDHYRGLVREHGDAPTATQMSREGKLYRYLKLFQVGDLAGKSVLDVGCGLGEMYPELAARFPNVRYQGIDLVPEAIAVASAKYPDARFRAWDITAAPLAERYDYVLMSALFNNATEDPTGYLERVVERAWRLASVGVAFNFLPLLVNFTQPTMAYHDATRVLDYCLRKLSPRVRLEHHYERCDVAVFVYR